MLKKIFYIAILLLLTIYNADAQFNKAGRTSLQFLKIGVGARQVALGETGIAGIHDINMVFWNPAAISSIEGVEASFNYNKWISDLNVMAGAVGINLEGFGTIALNYIALNYGDIQEALVTSTSGNTDTRTGSNFTGNDLSVGVAYSRQFTDKLSIGFNIKYIQEKLFIYTASTWGFDVGSFYNTGWRGIKLAMSAQNFSSQARWLHTKEETQQSFELPLVFRIGVSMDVLGGENLFLGGNPELQKLSFNVDAIHTNDYAERIHIGAEYTFFNMLMLRGGYRFNYEEGNLSLGAGVNYELNSIKMSFDYAYVNYDFLQSPHRFTISLNF